MLKTPLRWDARRLLALPGSYEETVAFAVDHWIDTARAAIAHHDFFAVALSGGATPQHIFHHLMQKQELLDWTKVYLFWSDERNVSPDHPESNYYMAIEKSGLGRGLVPPEQIFRMVAERDLAANAAAYEFLIQEKLGSHPFDLIMLGMGEDGHVASLFPHTAALQVEDRLVVENYLPKKEKWRMTFTYTCINRARHIALYVVGKNKARMVAKVLTSEPDYDTYPAQRVGTPLHPALWILDSEASSDLPLS